MKSTSVNQRGQKRFGTECPNYFNYLNIRILNSWEQTVVFGIHIHSFSTVSEYYSNYSNS